MQALYRAEALAQREGWTDDLAYVAGTLRADLGDLDGALTLWSRIDAPDAARLREQARAQLLLGRWEDARHTLGTLVDSAPDDSWAQLQLGTLLVLADPEQARAVLEQAAQDTLREESAEQALAVLDDADSAGRAMRLGFVMIEEQQWGFAEMSFAQAASWSSPYPEALAALGFSRVAQGKDGAQELLTAARLAPQNSQVRYFQGIAARAQGNLPAALDALGQAVALDPENPAFYVEVGQTYRRARDLAAAERWMLLAVDVSGGAQRYLELLALFYADEAENLTTSGVGALQDLLGVLPPSPDAQAGYGWAMYLAGDHALGKDLIARALNVEPGNARALYYQARILLDEDSTTEAVQILEPLSRGSSPFAARASALLEGLNE